jgi:hypothetical protein
LRWLRRAEGRRRRGMEVERRKWLPRSSLRLGEIRPAQRAAETTGAAAFGRLVLIVRAEMSARLNTLGRQASVAVAEAAFLVFSPTKAGAMQPERPLGLGGMVPVMRPTNSTFPYRRRFTLE